MIPFTKAHACGNDFLIVPLDQVRPFDLAELTRRLCERNTGIGADGVEYFEWHGDTSCRVHLRNADGSVAEISGNGTRCVAAWMAEEKGAQPGDILTVETDAGPRTCTIEEFRDSEMDGVTTLITSDMGEPEFAERTVELSDGTAVEGVYVNLGNPHFVIVLPRPDFNQLRGGGALDAMEFVQERLDFSIGDRPWEDIGAEICQHPDFPDQTNVEFVHLLAGESQPVTAIGMRIFERGVGPTSSSGTGTSAAATAVIGVHSGEHQLEVISPGGAQTVQWPGPGESLLLTGPATLIAQGDLY